MQIERSPVTIGRAAGRSDGDPHPRASLVGVPPVESSPAIPETIGAAIDDALDALDALVSLGEEVQDEWQYVQDLADAWRDRLDAVEAGRSDETLLPERGAAVQRVCVEARLIEDPHRAIDWLSTFPQIVLAAIGERP